ncbi:hypothetical protein LDP20_02765 [Pseudomonas aeruginosa]|uniref:hypothetical protein n=1 Tax=Pseudomonas aeruginosa TaxID=287 RepID=UPI001EED7AD6|nr:hypothetical protein [Pseudomonas aeruginosa]MCG6990772.1 hypothetical protein [Pseudomonas aeruginosa]
MTNANECTCPSGDGSLRHPCPAHPASVELAGVAANLTFINGRPAMCGCQVEYSSGGGEYSDVIYVTLCAKHSGSAILDLVATNRIALTPEYEGQWHADLYLDREIPLAKAEGATPAEAVLALMSAERIDPEQGGVDQAGGDRWDALQSIMEWTAAENIPDDRKLCLIRNVARAALAQPSPTLPPFAEKVLAKLRRFNECAEDSDSGGVDIGRHWLDLLTQLGLLNRVQRSPALWEISQQGEDVLGLDVPEIEVPDSMIEKAWQRFERTLQQLETPGQAEQAEQAEAERPEVAEVAFVLRSIGAMDAEDIDGDNVDLRFEDAEGRDTGCDASIVEYAEKAADLLEQQDRIVGALRYKAELYDEVWALVTGKGYMNVTTAISVLESERDAALARVTELELKLDQSDYAYDNDRHHMRGMAKQAAEAIQVFTGHDSGANLAHRYGEKWWEHLDELRDALLAFAKNAPPAQAQHSVPDHAELLQALERTHAGHMVGHDQSDQPKGGYSDGYVNGFGECIKVARKVLAAAPGKEGV